MSKTLSPPKNILITGASSGIGEALARDYAAPGVFLALSGRNTDRLEDVAKACRAFGAEVEAKPVDAAERDQSARWIADVDARQPLDLIIANAGTSSGSGGRGETEDQARDILSVNMAGVLNTVWPVIGPMRERGSGQIAIVSSIAAFRGLPGAPAYAASKAAVKNYGEGLRGCLAGNGIRVSVVCPGFVRTRMTEKNIYPMPFIMDADKAAHIIRRGLERNKARIAFPWPMYLAAWLLGALPPGLTDGLFKKLPKKD
ncbi:MAG: SDR family NAD(P)-dependent oxidoreductase [Rhodospirillales bacterium]|nr:SDR family NAD(P)-dependent oxidoreductase [Alphaproteobacteria bacterium]MBL6947524.1 SDR family NAD(P)-dependent oxidoreductase [Rhodospirillales bacterium]